MIKVEPQQYYWFYLAIVISVGLSFLASFIIGGYYHVLATKPEAFDPNVVLYTLYLFFGIFFACLLLVLYNLNKMNKKMR